MLLPADRYYLIIYNDIMGRLTLLFLLLLYTFESTAQPKQEEIPQRLSIKQIHPTSKKVEKLTKLELGIDLPRALQQKINNFIFERPVASLQKVNPFLEWEFSVKAHFTHIESGTTVIRDGFYYREVKRDEVEDTWRDQPNSYPMRIRFSPDEEGSWSVEISVAVFGKTVHQSIPFTFEVADTKKPGYISVHDNNKYLERDGEPILLSGMNYPSPYTANNILYSHTKDAKLNLEAWTLFQNDIKQYAQQGGKHFRFFLSPAASGIEFEKLGNYYDRLHFAWEVDKMLETCEANDVLLNFNMLLHTPIMVTGDYYQFRYDYADVWHDETAWPYKDINYPYAYSAAFNSKTPSDMFLNEEPMRYIKQRVRYIIARWGYSTAISLFELLSEPWHLNEDAVKNNTPYDSISDIGNTTRKGAHQFHKQIADYIKNDLKHDQHLLGAVGRLPFSPDEARIFSHPTFSNGYNDSTWFDKNIDVVSISFYNSAPHKMIISKNGKSITNCEAGENSYHCAVERLQNTYNKPVVFSESDHGDGTNDCSELLGHTIDLMRVNTTGAAGHYIWAAFMYPHKKNNQTLDQRKSWTAISQANSFFNKPFVHTVIDSFGTQGRQRGRVRGEKEYLKEHQYILSSNQESGFGYVYNRTFNVGTAIGIQDSLKPGDRCYLGNEAFMKPRRIDWKPKRLKIEGLSKRENYIIRFYSFGKGSFLTAVKTKSNLFGKINLVHPSLGYTKEIQPLIWYEVEQLD